MMNRGYLLLDRFDRPPVITCSHDPVILEHFAHEIAQVDSVVVTTVNARRRLRRTKDAVYLLPVKKWQFATHLGLDTHHGGTVTFWALELAYLLGWTKTILIGMDHNYARQTLRQGEVQTAGHSDADHFTPNYLPKGAKFIVGDLAFSEYSFLLARAAFEAAGRDVVDCTIDGACQVFRKGDLATELEDELPRNPPPGSGGKSAVREPE
ncbi:hypothetical protein QYF68_21285 [Mycolicibacterium austroafricanum]|uniref:DUF115 domain-containing protein n=1 Tax=Mycolicibacterium austroafricanum TaxID=39687 RepID=A0ABT8HHT9_MYCAO|nr:hypothetical protein [Mycolicibacterium austroafricanum]MDN4520335.1 hypothetical protein [Mycolicibacterium austroafricanum]